MRTESRRSPAALGLNDTVVEQVKIVVPEQVNPPIAKSIAYFKLAAAGVEPAGKTNVSCAELFGF
jgi:hypothetical protein